METEEQGVDLLEDDSQKNMFMTFQTGKESFGISIDYVNEIIVIPPITPVPEVEPYIKGLINVRGKIIPVIDVRTRFRMEPVEYTDRTCIILLNLKGMMVGLIVERIEETIVIDEDKVLAPPFMDKQDSEHNKFVYGIARTEEYGVKLLLDPWKLISDETPDPAGKLQSVNEEEE
ncbi:MAG: purine-binding chemotaxis protein CheW [Agathobacter sp.]|nr:purine-binding chemotaxis protein CheW [Agathobacter sp.]